MKSTTLQIILFCFLGIISCEREKENQVQIENENIPLLTREIFTNDLYNVFTYNNANLLYEEKTKTSYSNYSYNAENQLINCNSYYDTRMFSDNLATVDSAMNRTEWVNPQNTKKFGQAIYSYSHGMLEKITISSVMVSESVTTYDYDRNGRIGKRTFYTNNIPFGFIEYTYDSNGNLILETKNDLVNGKTFISLTKTYEFDNKRNPFNAFRRTLMPGRNTNVNNIVKETLTFVLDTPGVDNPQVTESNYEYNDKDYPVLKNNMIRYEYK